MNPKQNKIKYIVKYITSGLEIEPFKKIDTTQNIKKMNGTKYTIS